MRQQTQFTLHKQSSQKHSPQAATPTPLSEIFLLDVAEQAQHYLNNLSIAFETQQLGKTRLLERLFQDLTQALADYSEGPGRESLGNNRPDEHSLEGQITHEHLQAIQQLEKKHHLQWLCNQARYYLTQPYSRPQQHKDRAQWQIKATVKAIAKFRLIVHLRSLLPGQAPKTIPWRDILPGFKR